MLQQKAAQLRAGEQALLDVEQEGFHIGALRMRALAGPGAVDDRLGNHAPIEEGKEGAVALHDGIMFQEEGQGTLVKGGRVWYNHVGLLAGSVDHDFFPTLPASVP